MAYPNAIGQPNNSGGSIPHLYAMKLLIAFYASTVFGSIATTEYEGELKNKGDKLSIRTLPDMTVRDHVDGQDLEYENLSPGQVDLLIDKGKYWALNLNAVNMHQIDYPAMEKWAEHSSINLKVAVDSDVLSNIYLDVHAANKGDAAGAISGGLNLGKATAPVALTRATILEFIIEQAGVCLDEQNVPDEGRWFLLPSWACGLLKTSDLRDNSVTGDKSTLRNGRIGMIDRFEIYQTNNLKQVTDTHQVTNAIFGHKCSTAFASQMLNTETLKNPKAFGDLMRSLHVYGYKVIKPEALGHAYIRKG